MSFLTINGEVISVAAGSASISTVPIGSQQRAFSGSLLTDVRAYKHELRCQTTPLLWSEYRALEHLLMGHTHNATTAGTNLLLESFETGIGGMAGSTSGQSQVTTPKYSGSYALKLTQNNITNPTYTVGVSASRGVVGASLWAYGTRYLKAYLYDADNAQTGSAVERDTTSDDWLCMRCYLVLAADTDDLRLYLSSDSLLNLGSNCFVDYIKISQATPILTVAGDWRRGVGSNYGSAQMVASIDDIELFKGRIGGYWYSDLCRVTFTLREI
jgi:hypothetical protein